jgi:hypothetical protein
MNNIVKHSIRFFALVIIQTMILNQVEIGLGVQIMVYPLYIILLPFELSTISLMLIAFLMGIIIDSISNTYGLHASSLVLLAFLRPQLLSIFAPRDGYDPLKEGNVYEMGRRWFFSVFVMMLVIHHLWFFLMEVFRIDQMLYVFQKTILSVPLSYLLSLLLQALFIAKPKER